MKRINKKIVADIDTGELHELTALNQNNIIHISDKQIFIKVFYELISIIDTLTKNELILIKYIMLTIKPNKLIIENFNYKYCNMCKSTFSKTSTKLIDKNIIYKKNNSFYVNPNMLFNGRYYKF